MLVLSVLEQTIAGGESRVSNTVIARFGIVGGRGLGDTNAGALVVLRKVDLQIWH